MGKRYLAVTTIQYANFFQTDFRECSIPDLYTSTGVQTFDQDNVDTTTTTTTEFTITSFAANYAKCKW